MIRKLPRRVAPVLALLLAVATVACGGGDSEGPTTAVEPDESPPPELDAANRVVGPVDVGEWVPSVGQGPAADNAGLRLVGELLVGTSFDESEILIVDLDSGGTESIPLPGEDIGSVDSAWAVDDSGAIGVVRTVDESDVGLAVGGTSAVLDVHVRDASGAYQTTEVDLGETSPDASHTVLTQPEGFAVVTTYPDAPWTFQTVSHSGTVSSAIDQPTGLSDYSFSSELAGSGGFAISHPYNDDVVANWSETRMSPIPFFPTVDCDQVCATYDMVHLQVGSLDLSTFEVTVADVTLADGQDASADIFVDGAQVFTVDSQGEIEGLDRELNVAWRLPAGLNYWSGTRGAHGTCLVAQNNADELYLVDLSNGEIDQELPSAESVPGFYELTGPVLCSDQFVVIANGDGFIATRIQ